MAQDYKDTMNLPSTDFAMRAGLPRSEPERLAKWTEMDLYHRVLRHNEGHPSYILHDGPPYANGPIHIGHAFNKVLKDIIVRYKSQRGFFAPYVPGWDCHGQPIEHMVETKVGTEKMRQLDQVTIRRLCRDWARENIDVQREGFKRLGVLGEWDDPYLTYTPSYEAGNVRIFKTMYEAGAIYRGRKPIHWCYHCHTALAEAEIEYGDEVASSIYVAFELEETPPVFAAPKALGPLFILIWTTTPWTLPANTAVSLAPQASYVCVQVEGRRFILAESLVPAVAEIAGWEGYDFLRGADGEPIRAKGSALEGLHYAHPIHENMQGCIVTGEHVSLDTGTGAVHTAPGHGQDDYQVGLAWSLPTLMPVDDNGVFDAGGGPFEGLGVDAANPLIIDWLHKRGVLVAQAEINHSYPHCWRCHNPVIFRATDQWFVSMEDTNLREKALAEIGTLNWYPTWAANRLRSMVEGRPDWCISRQRSWGVPIPVFRCAQCASTVATSATFDAVTALFEREGADAWFIRKPEEYLPPDIHCEQCGSTELVPECDILDVWWESGVSHTSVLEAYSCLSRPADLYLEGSDQHRGWFQSSLLTSVGAYGLAPYRGVMSCGFTVDEEGRKMSKSLGNGIDPAEVIAESGADVLRLWVGSVDSSQDVSISKNIIARTSDAYRRFRNTFRFLLSNLNDFTHAGVVGWADLTPIDRWALVRLLEVSEAVTEAYESFRFHIAYHTLYDYVTTDLSAVYFDALKDRLYSDAPDDISRRSAQSVLANILEVLVRQLAPILCFTCDEVLEHYPAGLAEGRPEAAALSGWPERSDVTPPVPKGVEEDLLGEYRVVLGVRDAVTKALEEARSEKLINKSQEAKVTVRLAPLAAKICRALPKGTLEELFIVAEVELEEGLEHDGQDALTSPEVQVKKAVGEKCPRCWNIRELGLDPAHPELCSRCAAVLAKLQLRKRDEE
ncbi:MAG: isoleucine--tRNA ligase [Coriobacteriales bacterium]|nr:isoleucine--tRNA ligase [Coriobacteriales bacterium]